MTGILTLLSGILASSVHVVTGPDHLAAVTPLAIENRKKAWNIGLMWGIGHVTGMLLIGLLYMVFKMLIDVEKISHHSEVLVGFVLIGIGIWAIIKTIRKFHFHHVHPHFHDQPEPRVHIHRHEHAEEGHHIHTHQKTGRQNSVTALLIGTLHGFAGISHFLLFLPTLALPGTLSPVLYLTGFATGTILAMVTYAVVLGIISQKTAGFSNSKAYRNLRIGAGILAIAVGVYWLI